MIWSAILIWFKIYIGKETKIESKDKIHNFSTHLELRLRETELEVKIQNFSGHLEFLDIFLPASL